VQVEQRSKGDLVFTVVVDEFPESPRDWDNWGTILFKHPRYTLGDIQLKDELEHYYYKNEGEENEEEFKYECWEDYIYGELDAEILLPIYMYDHSGITIRVDPFSSRFDSGQVGFIYVTQEDIDKLGKKFDHNTLVKFLVQEIETYDCYLRGEVYHYTVVKEVTCESCGHVENEHQDSCGGFYDNDFALNGLYESAGLDNLDEWEEL